MDLAADPGITGHLCHGAAGLVGCDVDAAHKFNPLLECGEGDGFEANGSEAKLSNFDFFHKF
ncbi:hypothetical protein MASR2M8_16210 [Opitutaceae bacterium]